MINIIYFISNFRLQGPYSKNYLSDRSFTNVNDYEFVDNFATPDTAAQTGKYGSIGWIFFISSKAPWHLFIFSEKHF